MGSFMRSVAQLGIVEPVLDAYELDDREPCIRIGHDGTPFLLKQIRPVPSALGSGWNGPKVLFADVPVIIHTAWGFSLAPLSEASAATGPEQRPPATEELLALILDDMPAATNRDLAADGPVGDEEVQVWKRIEAMAKTIRDSS